MMVEHSQLLLDSAYATLYNTDEKKLSACQKDELTIFFLKNKKLLKHPLELATITKKKNTYENTNILHHQHALAPTLRFYLSW